MDVKVDARWDALLDEAVRSGRYASPAAVIDESLSMMAEREKQIAWLRDKVSRSIADGGDLSDEEVGESLDQLYREFEAKRAA